MACHCQAIPVICVVLVLGVPVSASWSQTAVPSSIRMHDQEIIGSLHCDARSPEHKFELLSPAPRRVSTRVLNANCVAQFLSRRRQRDSDASLDWEAASHHGILCREDTMVEVRSASGGKPMFCGALCLDGRPIRYCTR
jgi:hypothetical protein